MKAGGSKRQSFWREISQFAVAAICVSGSFASLNSSAFADEQPTLEHLETNCAAKMRSSCVKAAASHQETGNTAMAMAMLKRACFLKHKDSCVKLAETALQSNLPGLAKDALQEGCRFKSKWACNELARLDSEKNALKTVASDDPEKSLMVWSLACSKGSPSGCRREGETEALLGRQDAARASFLRGCTLGDKLSCSQVIGVPAH